LPATGCVIELLPLLASYNPAICLRLNELCRQMAIDEDDWSARVEAELLRTAELTKNECRLPCAALAGQSPAVAARMVRAALQHVRGDLRRLDADHVKAILALASGAKPQGELHLPGAWVGRRYGFLLLRRQPPRLATVDAFAITGPGVYPLGDGRFLSVHLADDSREEGPSVVEFCNRQVGFPLQVRAPRPGDRLQPAGMTGTRKLQDLFVDLKLPLEERTSTLLVFGADRLLWVAGIRRCEGLRPAATGPVLRLELAGSVTR